MTSLKLFYASFLITLQFSTQNVPCNASFLITLQFSTQNVPCKPPRCDFPSKAFGSGSGNKNGRWVNTKGHGKESLIQLNPVTVSLQHCLSPALSHSLDRRIMDNSTLVRQTAGFANSSHICRLSTPQLCQFQNLISQSNGTSHEPPGGTCVQRETSNLSGSESFVSSMFGRFV